MSARTISHLGVDVATVERSDAEWRDDLRGLRLWREEFARLLCQGLSREAASAQLTARIEAGEAPPELLS